MLQSEKAQHFIRLLPHQGSIQNMIGTVSNHKISVLMKSHLTICKQALLNCLLENCTWWKFHLNLLRTVWLETIWTWIQSKTDYPGVSVTNSIKSNERKNSLIIGKTGVGKSSLSNVIAGLKTDCHIFPVSSAASSCMHRRPSSQM